MVKMITKTQLINANRKSILLGYNRNIKPQVLAKLPDDGTRFPITLAFPHHFKQMQPCETHIRCIITISMKPKPKTELKGKAIQKYYSDLTQVIVDMPEKDFWKIAWIPSELETQAIKAETTDAMYV